MANSGYLTSQDPVRMYSRAGEEQGPLREKSWRPCRHMSDMSQSSSERKGLVLLDSESQHLCPPPSPWDVVLCPAWCPLRGAKDTMGCRLIPLSLPPSWLIWCSHHRGCSTVPGTVLRSDSWLHLQVHHHLKIMHSRGLAKKMKAE